MAKIDSLDAKFQHGLGDVYDAEHRFLEAMQAMREQASDKGLAGMIEAHIDQTEGQIRNLEAIYEALGKKPKRVKCDAATGIVKEGEKSMEEAADNPTILDCVIADAIAKSEHYEIASYRSLQSGAELMDTPEILDLLRENLAQEEQTAELVEERAPKLLRAAMKQEQAADR